MADICIGVDVSMERIDIWEEGRGHAVAENAAGALSRLARHWAKAGALVVFEATGCYDRALRQALEKAGVEHARVNPGKARDFAKAMGFLGKTDRVDARMLAEMGARLPLRRAEPASPARRALQALAARRRQLVAARKAEKCRQGQAADRIVRLSLRRVLAFYDREILRIETEIAALVASEPEIREAVRRLRTAPGVGPVVAATLLAEMPELGTIDRRAAAALAGIAPLARDSGMRTPRREIGGGRPLVRSALYLAANAASRHHPRFKTFRATIEARGRCKKAAIIAAARKLLTCLNAMLRDGTDFDHSPA